MKQRRIATAALAAAVVGLAWGCRPSEPTTAAQPPTAKTEEATFDNPVAVAKVLAKPDEFAGQELTVRGTMTAKCSASGCWFTMGQADAEVMVKVADMDMAPLPGAVGQEVLAHGRLEMVDGQLTLTTDGVKVP